MGKRAREFAKRREDLDAMIRVQTDERDITSDVYVRGIGRSACLTSSHVFVC